MDSIVIAGR